MTRSLAFLPMQFTRLRIQFVFASVVLAVGVLLPQRAESALLVYENFNYPAGEVLNGQGTAGGGFTSAWSSPTGNTIRSGDLAYAGLQTAGTNSAQLSFASASTFNESTRNITLIPDTAGTFLWISFVLLKEFAAAATSTGTLAEILLGGPVSSPLIIGDTTTSANLYGIFQEGQVANTTKVPTNGASDLLVVKISFLGTSTTPDRVDLFVNPTPGNTEPPVADATKSDMALNGGINTLGFAGDVVSTGDKKLSWDEMRIGTTYADVAPVPEPGSTALLLLGSLCLAARRRRG